ncbi:MAG: glycosyltransferase family 9 protein [Opitutaceae bacterium]|nr:glycosyltransferase family 9 protein [Opitutaceae bacterium]
MPVLPPAPASLCLVRLSALGDIVMVLPLVRWLQRCWPSTRLTWICGKGVLPILEPLSLEGIELLAIDKPRGMRDYLALRRQLTGRRFDATLCLQASWRANWIYPFIPSARRIGFSKDRAKDLHRCFVKEQVAPARPHLVEGFLQFAEALGLPWPETVEWRLPVDSAADASVGALLPQGPFLAINACSSKPERDWPAESLARMAAHAHRIHGLDTVLIGGPSPREREAAAVVTRLSGYPVKNLVGATRLPEMVAALGRCRLLLSPDTGAVHIANALGRPVVGLYAVAPAYRTGPFGRLEHSVDRFDEAVRSLLGKDPAHVPWAQRVHHPGAMALITEDEVRQRIDSVLTG